MITRKFAFRFLTYIIPTASVGLGIAYFDHYEQTKVFRLILILIVFSFIGTYWEIIHVRNSHRNTLKKHLSKLEDLGFELDNHEYLGKYNNLPTRIGYFRDNKTKLPSLRIEVSDTVSEYEINDMRTVFEEVTSQLNLITLKHRKT